MRRLLVLLLAAPALAADVPAARHVAAAHRRNALEAFAITLDGADWKDPSKAVSCRMSVAVSTAALARDPYDRRNNPVLMNALQIAVMSEIARCGAEGSMAFTTRTFAQVKEASFALMLRNAGSSFCREDADCEGLELSDPCGARPPAAIYSSQASDVYPMMIRRFVPALLNNVAQQVVGAAGALGDKHPDHALLGDEKARRCALFPWKDRELAAACVENACRAR